MDQVQVWVGRWPRRWPRPWPWPSICEYENAGVGACGYFGEAGHPATAAEAVLCMMRMCRYAGNQADRAQQADSGAASSAAGSSRGGGEKKAQGAGKQQGGHPSPTFGNHLKCPALLHASRFPFFFFFPNEQTASLCWLGWRHHITPWKGVHHVTAGMAASLSEWKLCEGTHPAAPPWQQHRDAQAAPAHCLGWVWQPHPR